MTPSQKALAQFEKDWKAHLDTLVQLVKIPSVSFPGFPPEEVQRSADKVMEILRAAGLKKVEKIQFPGAHPYVLAESEQRADRPTVLLYAHHDVQPAGREELWNSPAFEPTLREGPGGMRMYARGAADDKAGVLVHAAAIASYFRGNGDLPVNVKLVIEGEEETGSESLGAFLQKYKERLKADVMILTDTTNFDVGVPALTVALRGMVALQVEVRSLTKSVHSGMWGGPVPDPVMALNKALATLVDDQGRIAVPGILDGVKPLTAEEEKELKKIPFNEADFRVQCGMVSGAQLLREGPNPLAQTWRFPSLTVNAIQASSRANPSNIINDAAWAKVTVRLVAGMNPERVARLLAEAIKKAVPWGLEVKVTGESGGAGAWAIEPQGPAFEAAEKALEKAYGKPVVKMGCGGTIPFVEPFAEALGGAPALLVGVEDPYTNAHGENESVCVQDLKAACIGQILLFEELALRLKK